MAGRPSDYSDELAKEICDAISESSKGLRRLCDDNKHWPTSQTIRNWIRANDAFCSQYARAKREQADFLVEECLEISDNAALDTLHIEGENGFEKEVCNHEWINRARLRVDTRKWYASKLAPKIYGEKIQHTGANEGPIVTKIIHEDGCHTVDNHFDTILTHAHEVEDDATIPK